MLVVGKIPHKIGSNSDPKAVIEVSAVLKRHGAFQAEDAQDAVYRITDFRIVLRRWSGQIVYKYIFADTSQAHKRNIGHEKLSELIMNVPREIFISCTEPVIIQQAEAANGVAGDERCFITQEVFVIHEVHRVGIEEHACA